MLALVVMFVVLILAITAQSVALRDMNFARIILVKNQAYFNACSGVDIAMRQLKSDPGTTRVDSWRSLQIPRGDYQVDISREVAEAFGEVFSNLPPETPVFLIESKGRCPLRGEKLYEINVTAVIRMVEGNPQVLLWTENPGKTASSERGE